MLNAAKVFVLLSLVWAVAALIVQVATARGGGREDRSEPAGRPRRGILHNFTVAMLPWNKETVRDHPSKFLAGVVMHLGVIVALLYAAVILVGPNTDLGGVSVYLRVVLTCSMVSGACLFVRRLCSRDLRAMSAPEDYVANLVTCGLPAMAFLDSVDSCYRTALLVYVGVLFVFLPLGKLRHAVFFFVARGNYGRRLGYRGVYPPAAKQVE